MEAFFYFGIKTAVDIELVNLITTSLTSTFEKQWPIFSKNTWAADIIKILKYKDSIQQDLKDKFKNNFSENKKDKEIESSNANEHRFKLIFENLNILSSDELIKFIRKHDSEKFSIDNIFDKSHLQAHQKRIIKLEADIYFFCITKRYLVSELFKQNWLEAKKTNKLIVLLLLEKDLNIKELNHDTQNIFYFDQDRTMVLDSISKKFATNIKVRKIIF